MRLWGKLGLLLRRCEKILSALGGVEALVLTWYRCSNGENEQKCRNRRK